MLSFAVFGLHAQLMNHYWVNNFNSTSSLLGGAVIAGDADNTAIYYNPATIGDMQSGSNISLAASLFSWNIYNFNDALGEGIDLSTDNFLVQPQFISYTYKPHLPGLSISVSALTRVKERLEITYIDSRKVNVIPELPGEETYNTTFNYRNDYTDSWVGAALSHEVSDRFSYGVSLFASFSTLNYLYNYSATAINELGSSDTINFVRTAEGSYKELIKFTDYRLVAKFGLSYKLKTWRFGLTIKAPSWRLFSSGKRAQRIDRQINISRNGLPAGLSDYTISDGQEKDQLTTNFIHPFSLGFGFLHYVKPGKQKLYFSMEFFVPINGYKMVDAELNSGITTENVYDTLSNKDWTSYAYASNYVFNVAIGYSWKLSDDLIFLNALRTDFSAINNADLGNYKDINAIKTTTFNIYHYSCGVEFTIKRNRFIAGGDFAFGYQKNLRQIANFSDPVEYEPVTGRALQGPLTETMSMNYIGISVYIGATLNFSKKDDTPEK